VANGFQILVYANRARDNASSLVAANWGNFAEGLKFGTNAFGGYGACSFTLKTTYANALAYVNGWGASRWIGDRIRIVDSPGKVCYEGMIYNLNLKLGGESASRSMDSMFNVARMDYNVPFKTSTKTNQAFFDDASSRALYGKKVSNQQIPGSFPNNTTTPASTARRFIKQNRTPGKSQSKTKGGSDQSYGLEVTCVGLMTPALEWRWAFCNLATQVDTSRIVKDMLVQNPITEGTTGAGRDGNGAWVEPLNAGNNLGYGQDFISGTDFTHIASSGTTVERNVGSGSQRIDIVKGAAQYGSVNDKRMLFQVWDDNIWGGTGRGLAYFQEMSETRPFQTGYSGYYDDANLPQIYDAGQHRLPLYRVRAGNWLTTLGLVPNGLYPTIYDDPRCFWIESGEYDVDAATLTLQSASNFDLNLYIGRLIGGKRVIKGGM
jgi:hypothetical protein